MSVLTAARCTLLLGALTAGCASSPFVPEHTFRGSTMGTTYAVTIAGHPSAPAGVDQLEIAVDDLLASLDGAMSTYDPQSEVSIFNRSSSTDWFVVSPHTLAVFRLAREVSELTNGAFDVTVAPLVDAWGFGAAGEQESLPSDAEVDRLLARVGYWRVEMDDTRMAIRKTSADVAGDLSAVAKGYAVDRVAELLDDAGHTSYLVEVGGEVRTRGQNGQGRPWRVGIERPSDGPSSLQRVVDLVDASLATSGDYRNYVEHDGVRLSHTIDPRTGRPVMHGLASVSVIARSCARADAMATALEVLGPDDGYALAVRLDWAALLITRHEDGEFREVATPAFQALTGPVAQPQALQ